MKRSDRRLADRLTLAIPLAVRKWKSSSPEEKVESLNLSEGGVYFATDTPLARGMAVQVCLEMPTELTGLTPAQRQCTGHIVRVEPIGAHGNVLGVGVRFDYYEVAC